MENRERHPSGQTPPPVAAQMRRTTSGRAHSPSRERVLRAVEFRGATTVAEIAAATGLHENTVRGHLSSLQTDGHVRQQLTESSGRGRPSHRWQAVPPEVQHPYAGLAATLANALLNAGSEASTLARAAGHSWGSEIAAQSPEATDADTLLTSTMREQGFDPYALDDHVNIGDNNAASPAATRRIILRRCPLLAAAQGRTAVVCAVHEGMIEGLLRSGSPDARAELLPFAADGACLLHVQSAHRAA